MDFTQLQKIVEECRNCPLGAGRKNAVLGKGSTEAKLMFVGEAPGEQEDLQGKPFVGPAGQLLDAYLDACGTAAGCLSGCLRNRKGICVYL